MTNLFSESDLRQVTATFSQLIANEINPTPKRLRLLGALGEMIGACSWIWASFKMSSGTAIAVESIKHGFKCDSYASFLREKTTCFETVNFIEQIEALAGRQNSEASLNHNSPVVLDLNRSAGLRNIFTSAGISHAIASRAETGRDMVGLLIFCRPEGKEEFSAREEGIAQIIKSEAPWLFRSSVGSVAYGRQIETLPSRLSETLQLLIKGYQRKAMAQELNLSVHTVSDYIKSIYKHFDVHSQAELMRSLAAAQALGEAPAADVTECVSFAEPAVH